MRYDETISRRNGKEHLGMARFYNLCERRFQLGQNKTSIRTEILAGVTTFATMSYVLATVPNMLSNAGLPKGAVLTVLILSLIHI